MIASSRKVDKQKFDYPPTSFGTRLAEVHINNGKEKSKNYFLFEQVHVVAAAAALTTFYFSNTPFLSEINVRACLTFFPNTPTTIVQFLYCKPIDLLFVARRATPATAMDAFND
jgi:hypothetical protein